MIDTINKHKILILWTISLTVLILSIMIAEFRPFSENEAGVLLFISFNSAFLAMIFSEREKKDSSKIKIITYIILIFVVTIRTIIKLI